MALEEKVEPGGRSSDHEFFFIFYLNEGHAWADGRKHIIWIYGTGREESLSFKVILKF